MELDEDVDVDDDDRAFEWEPSNRLGENQGWKEGTTGRCLRAKPRYIGVTCGKKGFDASTHDEEETNPADCETAIGDGDGVRGMKLRNDDD